MQVNTVTQTSREEPIMMLKLSVGWHQGVNRVECEEFLLVFLRKDLQKGLVSEGIFFFKDLVQINL